MILIDSFILIPPVFNEDKYDICVVKVDALKDYILSLDSLYNIILKYKGKRTILVCNKMIYELATQINLFDKVFPIEINKFKKNYIYRFIQLRKLKKFKINVLLQPTFFKEKSLVGDSIIRALNSEIKIGHFGDYTNQSRFLKFVGNHWYSNLLNLRMI